MLLKLTCILWGVGLFCLIAFLVHQYAKWQIFKGSVVGTRVEGDLAAPPTRWWNHLYLLLYGWNKVAVLRLVKLKAAYGVYYIGYVALRGSARITKVYAGSHVRMRIGREPCRFFALELDGKEIPLDLVGVFDKKYPAYTDIPLF